MANVDRVNGFRLLSPKEGKYVQQCSIAAGYGTALAVGDVVKSSGTTDASGLVTINVAAAGDTTAMGVIIGFDGPPNRDNLSQSYSPASTAATALVYTDPFARYVVQEDSDTSTLAITDVGQLIDLIDAGVDTATGSSGMEIDSSSVTTSGQFRILELYRAPDNATGANAKWVVTFAEHQDITDAVAV